MVTAEKTDKNRVQRMQSQKLMEEYLKNATELTKGLSLNKANKKLRETVKDIPASQLRKMDAADIENKRRDILDAAKTYGTKAKINYAFDSRFLQDQYADNPTLTTTARVLSAGIVAGAAWGIGSVVSLANEKAGAIVAGYFVAKYVTHTAMAHLSRAKTESEKTKFDEYAELRHAALALKKLKKAVSVQKAFDAREGQRPTLTTLLAKDHVSR